ncbi:hypothetical protein [Candidatus Frankia alpina]|uniref:hypothetical protein n=1 Tax=Candidatus Frankia alpina TaxID=2699483 RepID=UPI001A99D565|nr:hypothetical protein [Candidatus Frankia alpina]
MSVSDPSDRFEPEATTSRVLNGPSPAPAGEAVARRATRRRAVSGLADAPAVQRWKDGQIEQVSANERARYRRRGQNWTEVAGQNNEFRIKHYLIAWKDQDTVVLGVKVGTTPYPGQTGYALGFPALAGGTSEITDAAMNTALGPQQTKPGADLLRNHTLNREVDQELLRQYVITGTPTPVMNRDDPENPNGQQRNRYRIWESAVQSVDNPAPIPANDPSYRENERTVEIDIYQLIALGINTESNVQQVLQGVALIANTPVHDGSGTHGQTYLAEDNHPMQALGLRLLARIREVEGDGGA